MWVDLFQNHPIIDAIITHKIGYYIKMFMTDFDTIFKTTQKMYTFTSTK